MPRTGRTKPGADRRLSDHVSWGLLTRVFPAPLVDQVLAETGRVEQRSRLLPARTVVYYVMGLALFSQHSYEEVMRSLAAAQDWGSDEPAITTIPTKAALFKARVRLGSEPLEALFAQVAVPLAGDQGFGFYRSARLMTLDIDHLDMPDTPANDEAFGRPAPDPAGAQALPQVQLLGLTETGSRAIVAIAVGPVTARPDVLTEEVVDRIPADALVIAGQGFFTPVTWAAARRGGADLLWRLPEGARIDVIERHPDGSAAARVSIGTDRAGGDRIEARVIEVEGGDGQAESCLLATTLADASAAPAAELSELYLRRDNISSVFEQVQAPQTGSQPVLRSKIPEGVRQELFAYLCLHYAIRWLLHGVDAGPRPGGPVRSSGFPQDSK